MGKVYKGAIIGCGLIAHHHARAYQDIKSAELSFVCDRNNGTAKRFAEKYNVPKYTTNYTEILKDQTIDFVEILTPHSTHLKIARDSILNRKAINLQKVPTVTIEELEQLKLLIKKNKATLRVFENFRYYEPYQFAKSLIDQGKIGVIKIVNIKKVGGLTKPRKGLSDGTTTEQLSSYMWRIKESENFKHPTIFDDGYHKHSLIEFFLGERVSQVRGWCNYENILPGVKIDSPFDIQYFTKSNKLGVFQSINIDIQIKNNFYPCDEVVEVIGQKGMIKVFGGHGLLFTSKHKSPIKQGVYWIGGDNKWKSNTNLNTDITKSFTTGLEKFIDSLDGKPDDIFTLIDAESSLKIGIGIIESLRNNNELITITKS